MEVKYIGDNDPIDGNNEVGKIQFENGKVYINHQKPSPSARDKHLTDFKNLLGV